MRTTTIIKAGPPGYFQEVPQDDPRAKTAVGRHAPSSTPKVSPYKIAECPHLGGELPALNRECGCRGARQCDLFNEPCIADWSTHTKVKRYCRACPEHPSKRQEPTGVHHVTEADLLPVSAALKVGPEEVQRLPASAIGRHQYFNCSLLEFGGELLLAVRTGWSGSNLAICELDPATLLPRRTCEIFPNHELCHAGREDPRLFVHRDALHVFFSGVQKVRGKLIVHPMLCRLESKEHDYHVAATWCPAYSDRQPWEKNWGMFSRDGELYAVHTIAPHVVLHLTGEQECFPFSRHAWKPNWAGGMLRGGASPVLVGDEYYSFSHGVLERPGQNPKRIYTAGVYTFQARPPFRPLRYTPEPILWPNNDDRPGRLDIAVVFPCGAVKRGNKWLVSYGYHDHHCEIATFDADDIERAMT